MPEKVFWMSRKRQTSPEKVSGITRIDRRRQDDGGKIAASIRTFNFGAVGNVSNADAKANFEKAFKDRTLGDQDLPGLDGSDV